MKVVLLPGLDGTGTLFKPLIDALPKGVEVLVISYPPDIKLNYDELVEFVVGKLPEEDFILIGESFSGPIAYQVALRIPKNIKSVIFVATFLDNPRPFLLGLSRLLPTSLIFSLPIPDFIIKSFLFNKTVSKRIVDLFKESLEQVSYGVLSFRLKQIGLLTENHDICNIKASYIQAAGDKLVSRNCVNAYKKAFNSIEIFQVEGPHFVLQTNPIACAEIVVNEINYVGNR